MKLLILTQNENLYLPQAFAKVCEAFRSEVACIVIAPAMSTHGGPVKGLLKHWTLFGTYGTLVLTRRVLWNKCRSRFESPSSLGPQHSIENVARAFQVQCFHVKKVNHPDFYQLIDRFQPDLLISISCPQVIGRRARQRFSLGAINVHGAPLPKYRGLMPAFWALRNQEPQTAVTVHDLADKLDNGQILVQKPVEITSDETWDSLVKKTKLAGAEALIDAIEQIRAGTVQRRPNRDEDATYFSFPTKADRQAFRAAGRRFF
jgi:methionyl-tRNA formyltransferase